MPRALSGTSGRCMMRATLAAVSPWRISRIDMMPLYSEAGTGHSQARPEARWIAPARPGSAIDSARRGNRPRTGAVGAGMMTRGSLLLALAACGAGAAPPAAQAPAPAASPPAAAAPAAHRHHHDDSLAGVI